VILLLNYKIIIKLIYLPFSQNKNLEKEEKDEDNIHQFNITNDFRNNKKDNDIIENESQSDQLELNEIDYNKINQNTNEIQNAEEHNIEETKVDEKDVKISDEIKNEFINSLEQDFGF
jgi:hypothetical protein